VIIYQYFIKPDFEMKVSTINVCPISAEIIEDAIRSILKQAYKNIQYIIVNCESL
jgi:glycosyltransferase involved in cell wall biosynthesis